jgi:hypothetical protein
VSRTRISQLKSLAAALDDTARIIIRTDGDPWLLKTEILCPAAGQGTALAERLLQSLNDAAPSAHSAEQPALILSGEAAQPATKSAVADFRRSLAGLESVVRKLEQHLRVASDTMADDVALRPVAPGFPDQAGKLPIEAVPYYGWYSRLQLRVSRLCELAGENQQPEIGVLLEEAGGRLEQAASGLALVWVESSVAAGMPPGIFTGIDRIPVARRCYQLPDGALAGSYRRFGNWPAAGVAARALGPDYT